MLLQAILILLIHGAFAENTASELTEKRLLLHSEDDLASELMAVKAELETTVKLLNNVLVNVSTLTQEVHYLKTSQQKVQGAVYTRWGRNTCPQGAEIVYHGYIAGKKYNENGNVADNLCLPFVPTWGNYTDGFDDGVRGRIYGTEIDIAEPNHIFPYAVNGNDMPCAVCKSARSTSVMIPARTNCYPGWTLEYTGYLMSSLNRADFQPYDSLCMDSLPEFVPHGGANDDEHILYLVEAHCGSLPCPPYVDGRELACAVCSV